MLPKMCFLVLRIDLDIFPYSRYLTEKYDISIQHYWV